MDPRRRNSFRPLLAGLVTIAAALVFARTAPAGSLDGVTINEFRGSPELFNDRTNTTSTVNVLGDALIFDAGEGPESLYGRISLRVDVRELCLAADRIVIRSPLVMPQTHVTIYARELRFERNGRVDTTPVRRRDTPLAVTWADGLAAGRNGDPGHPGGDVDVFVHQVISDASTSQRFVLRGGEGGPPGPGRDGLDDGHFPFLSDDWNRLMERAGNTLCGISDLGSVVIYRLATLNGRETSRCGAEVSVVGESAVPSGIPGPGGRGGTLRSTVPIGQYADVLGGAAGPRGGNYVGATLSGRAFVHEFISTIVRAGREITTTEEVDAPRERGQDAIAPVGTPGASGTFLFTTNAAPRLELAVIRTNGVVALRISWPSSATSFSLQHSTALSNPNWVEVPQAFMEAGPTRFVTTPLGADARFYRLVKRPVAARPDEAGAAGEGDISARVPGRLIP